jgi:hypothetical protein
VDAGRTSRLHACLFGTVIAAAKDVQVKKSARLVFRVKYKTKDGDRQNGQVYSVELFP